MHRLSRCFRMACLGWLIGIGVQATAYADSSLQLVSQNPAGVQGNEASTLASLSADGSTVAFGSWASNLIEDDTNNASDVFVREQNTGAITRVSVSSSGTQANAGSGYAHISADGALVAFRSLATNLVPKDTNDARDVFVHNLTMHTTQRVSVDSQGGQANGHSYNPVLSANGRYVVFMSDASNLVAGDTNQVRDIFMHDRVTRHTTRVSVNAAGRQANGPSGDLSGRAPGYAISADGRYVAFMSLASNLVPGDTNDSWDVFVRDLLKGRTRRVSVAASGEQGNGWSTHPTLSADGKVVAFASFASNLVHDDYNSTYDIFVYHRTTGAINRVSVHTDGTEGNDASGYPSLSGDGQMVAFASYATNLGNASINAIGNIYVHKLAAHTTRWISRDALAIETDHESRYPVVSTDGRFVAFESSAFTLVARDTNGYSDVFLQELLP